jgi:putative methyltransferase (TIGR04325 family)
VAPVASVVAEADDDRISFTGDYATFAQAIDAASDPGYDGDIAIDRYVRRFREVQADPAGVIRNHPDKLLPSIAMFGMAEPIEGVFEVLDFGGGYGALYDLLRIIFPRRTIRWTIVEVPRLVARGNEMGATDAKVFSSEIPADRRYSLVVASGSIQYTPDPIATFDKLRALNSPLMFVGRAPIVPSLERDRLTVESVPASLFKAKMPVWFFGRDWQSRLESFGEIVMKWDSPGDTMSLDGEGFCMSAFLLRRPQ